MIDDENENALVAEQNMAMTCALIAELHMLELQLQAGMLTEAGIDYGYRFCMMPSNVVPGNAAIVRERVLEQYINAKVKLTGLGRDYWDRPIVDVPADLAELDDGDDQ